MGKRNNPVTMSWRAKSAKDDRFRLFVYVHHSLAEQLGWRESFAAQALFVTRSELLIRPGAKGDIGAAAATANHGSFAVAVTADHITSRDVMRCASANYWIAGDTIHVVLPPWAWITTPPRHDAEQPRLEGVIPPPPGPWPKREAQAERMALLDRFAVAALRGIIGGVFMHTDPAVNASRAYDLADAMLAERDQRYGSGSDVQ